MKYQQRVGGETEPNQVQVFEPGESTEVQLYEDCSNHPCIKQNNTNY